MGRGWGGFTKVEISNGGHLGRTFTHAYAAQGIDTRSTRAQLKADEPFISELLDIRMVLHALRVRS